jgi:hypothetical protein
MIYGTGSLNDDLESKLKNLEMLRGKKNKHTPTTSYLNY